MRYNKNLASFKNYPEFHDIISINVFNFLCAHKCIIFSSHVDIFYDQEEIKRMLSIIIEQVFKAESFEFNVSIINELKNEPSECAKRLMLITITVVSQPLP